MVSSGNGSIAERWRELQGEHSWNGLLNPLDLDLRKFLISYGELVSATGYGFNKEERSPHYGFCMYGHDDLLIKSGVAAAGHYRVTKFVYATAAELLCGMQKETTWMGYVAVATDEGVAELGRRDIVVAWRGTLTCAERIKDLLFLQVPAEPVLGSAAAAYPSAKVHMGFLSVYTATASNASSDSEFGKTSARDQVLEEVRRLVEHYKDEETSITVVGHSLGGSLSILNAVDLISNGVNKSSGGRPPCPVTAVVFACPHVGNEFFKDAFDSFNDLKALHVKNSIDPVPTLPPSLPDLGMTLPDLGVTLPIDTTLSPYLKDPHSTAHELECYLHGVAGVQGSAGGFNRPEVYRDVALVNKGIDALKDYIAVPASWWVAEHKSMVKNDKGKWELKDFEQINVI